MISKRKTIFKKLVRFIQTTTNESKFNTIYDPIIGGYLDDESNSLLAIAACHGREQIVRFLTPLAETNIHLENIYGWTALMQAVRNGHLSIVLYLLSKGADPNHMTTFGTSVMSLAVRSGSLQVVKALKNNGYVPAKVNEISPELASVSSSRDDLLTELLSKPGNIDICMHNSLQLTPLMIAARNNDLNSVRTILQNSTQLVKQLETTDASGRRASENARSYGNTEMRNYLERKTKKYSEKFCGQNADRINPNTLINAIKSSKVTQALDIINDPLITPEKLNKFCSSDGATPLMYACMSGQIEIVEALLVKKVDVNAQDYENGWTSLMQATYYGHTDIAKKLILTGNADVLIPAKNNLTVFDMAMMINLTDTELFRLLADRSMGLNMKPEEISCDKDEKVKNPSWLKRAATKLGFSKHKPRSPECSSDLDEDDNNYGQSVHELPKPQATSFGATDWLEPIKPPPRFRHPVDEQLIMSQRMAKQAVRKEPFKSNLSKKYGKKLGSDSSSTMTPAKSLSSLGSIHDVKSVLQKLKR